LAAFCEENQKIKLLLASMKLIASGENISSNPLQEACSSHL
jgi:hypothetical protein